MKYLKKYNESSDSAILRKFKFDIEKLIKDLQGLDKLDVAKSIDLTLNINQFTGNCVYKFRYDGKNYSTFDSETQQQLFIDDKLVSTSQMIRRLNKAIDNVYQSMEYNLYRHVLQFLIDQIVQTRSELRDRLEEFNIIKNNSSIDLISLNQLFDYYNKPFDENKIKDLLYVYCGKNTSFE